MILHRVRLAYNNCSSVIGSDLMRRPVAWCTALTIAADSSTPHPNAMHALEGPGREAGVQRSTADGRRDVRPVVCGHFRSFCGWGLMTRPWAFGTPRRDHHRDDPGEQGGAGAVGLVSGRSAGGAGGGS